jgi:AP-1-like factor
MGSSPFAAPVPQAVVQMHQMKEMDEKTRSVITCQGTKGLPKTVASDSNVEVLAAWKTITSTPAFKVSDGVFCVCL